MGVASGTVMVIGGAWAGWFLVVCFTPCAAILAMSLRSDANELVLDTSGYTIKSTFRSITIPWVEVERIGTIEGPREVQVAIRFTPQRAAGIADAAAISAALGGYHRTLPLAYGLSATDLADLMRSYADASV